MNREEFQEEVKHYINQTFDEFSKYQMIVQDILFEFDRVCRNNNLHYFLAYGSLLGAIRDNGQIPWDYDVDVLFPVTDLQKLIAALETDLQNQYYYVYTNNHDSYPTSCLRVCMKDYSWKAIHVDVFFLVGCPNDKIERDVYIKKCMRTCSIRSAKYLSKHFPSQSNSLINKLLNWCHRNFYWFVSNKCLNRKENSLFYKYPMTQSESYYTYGGIKLVYPKEIFVPKDMHISGHNIMVPSQYERFLTLRYGDWKSYLPIKERFEEFYKMKNIVDDRQVQYQEEKR